MKGRMGGALRLAITLGVIAVGFGAISCKPKCSDFESPCAERFSVGGWCVDTGLCTADSSAAECFGTANSGTCDASPDELLAIPLSAFYDSLGSANDLLVFPANCRPDPNPGPDPFNLSAMIDGIVGTEVSLQPYSPIPSATITISWADLDGPQVLELSFAGGTCQRLSFDMQFADAVCEDANPQPPCDPE